MPPQGGRKHPHQEFVQVDTTDILFICGGAFIGLDKIIQNRVGKKVMGFKTVGESVEAEKIDDIMAEVHPTDFIQYGLIPEFVGRLPVVAVLAELDEADLERILLEPKNSLIKQYQKFFEFENVRLSFTDSAIKATAREAQERKTGARGLRAILEEVMLDIMYDLPSLTDIKECVISEEVITQRAQPLTIYEKKAV